MADSSSILKLALFGGAGYLAYQWLLAPAAKSAAPPASNPATTPAPDPNKIVGANTLDPIYAKMVAAAKAPAEGLTVDQWGWFLMNAQPSVTAPDPMSLFPAAVPGFSRDQPISAAQYWAVVSPNVKTQLGLSGLGMFGSLFRQRGW